jgi:Na+/proline symporter
MITKEIVVLAMAIGYIVLLFILGGVGKWIRLREKTITEFFRPTGVAPAWMLWFAMGANMHTAFAIPGSMGFYYAHGVGFTMHWVWTLTTTLFGDARRLLREPSVSRIHSHIPLRRQYGLFYG